ncbi:alpha/beta-hydrolase [Roridomyces roridus]|uniref:Alpha/beta-hydrolase n=1 Tax=Roridomyces roridus TaxID=1738132 RepID=A0AAD7C8X0_9AGAR|nr:alpha/beta-hydrolase [Roridomyces roridus]
MDPTRYKNIKTRRGFTYSYYYSHPAPGKPVILLVHGFPGGSAFWRKQVPFLESLGYGLLVPDLLGYGATDKPTDPKVYVGSGQAHDLVDVMDAESVERVIIVAHDWGLLPASRLINYHPARVTACAFLAGGYNPPSKKSGHQAARHEAVKKTFGFDAFAYMRFFVEPDAAQILESHIDSFISLMYPEDMQMWKENLCVDGGARKWLEADTIGPLPAYFTPEDKEHLKNSLLTEGMTAPLCWYRAATEDLIADDDAQISDSAAQVHQPLLYVAFTGDILALPMIADAYHSRYAKGTVTRKEIPAGHWGPESHAEELNVILFEWIGGLKT